MSGETTGPWAFSPNKIWPSLKKSPDTSALWLRHVYGVTASILVCLDVTWSIAVPEYSLTL